MQHYVIKFVSDLRQVGGFIRVLRFYPGTLVLSGYSGFIRVLRFYSGTPVLSIIKTNRHNITEILLKMALNTITRTPNQKHYLYPL